MKDHKARWTTLVAKILAPIVLSIMVCFYIDYASAQSSFAKLKVIMIRKVVEGQPATQHAEHSKSTYTVRFRLEISGDHDIYVLSSGGKGSPPLGYKLERSDRGIIWLEQNKETGELRSPGIERLSKTTSASWIQLPPMSALEWEIQAQSSRTGVQESRTVFVREGMNSAPTELLSDWYALGEETH